MSEDLTGIQILGINFETTRRKEMSGQTIVPTISDNANDFVHAMYIMLRSSSCNFKQHRHLPSRTGREYAERSDIRAVPVGPQNKPRHQAKFQLWDVNGLAQTSIRAGFPSPGVPKPSKAFGGS